MWSRRFRLRVPVPDDDTLPRPLFYSRPHTDTRVDPSTVEETFHQPGPLCLATRPHFNRVSRLPGPTDDGFPDASQLSVTSTQSALSQDSPCPPPAPSPPPYPRSCLPALLLLLYAIRQRPPRPSSCPGSKSCGSTSPTSTPSPSDSPVPPVRSQDGLLTWLA